MRNKSKKCRRALVQTTLQLHTSVHALSTFAESSSLCTLRPLLTGGPWPSCSIWGCSLLQEINSASLLVFLFLPQPGKCLSSGGGYHRASMHGASMVQLSPRFCSSRELLSCKDHSSQKKHLTWDEACLPYSPPHCLNKNILICLILHFSFMSCNISAWLFWLQLIILLIFISK